VARIVLVHPGDDSYGIDRVALATAQALTKVPHEVLCLLDSSNPGSSWLSEQLNESSIRWRSIDLAHLSRSRLSQIRPMARWLVSWIAGVPALLRLTRRTDLVYINGLTMLPTAIVLRIARRKTLWHLHEIPPRGHTIGRIIRRLSHRQICVSRAVADGFGLAAPRSQVVHNGVAIPATAAIQRSATADTPVRIGIVARINAWKGHAVLADAFAILRTQGLACRLVVVGAAHPDDRTMETDLTDRLAPFVSTGEAILVGQCAEGAEAMLELDVLAAPSTRPDPFPVSVLEAMARGLPVVATRLGGHPEAVIDQLTGLLVPASDPSALAEALSRLVVSRRLRESMGTAGRDRCIERFSAATFELSLTAAVDAALQ
jgi:glycosyltransferase involved in cell wall biosynthesis